ncbi:hypothetical protein SORBI_3001G518050 [Sorghum bicolor]|uniref:Uncharacterized protein n=1 Tax=Sorghum bicolor TaxID=4558 RepID=A0A1Z5SBL2_SORBI|nr:hypothetical protein SORBI_3001G518050 [Sorghum bicolor]
MTSAQGVQILDALLKNVLRFFMNKYTLNFRYMHLARVFFSKLTFFSEFPQNSIFFTWFYCKSCFQKSFLIPPKACQSQQLGILQDDACIV